MLQAVRWQSLQAGAPSNELYKEHVLMLLIRAWGRVDLHHTYLHYAHTLSVGDCSVSERETIMRGDCLPTFFLHNVGLAPF